MKRCRTEWVQGAETIDDFYIQIEACDGREIQSHPGLASVIARYTFVGTPLVWCLVLEQDNVLGGFR